MRRQQDIRSDVNAVPKEPCVHLNKVLIEEVKIPSAWLIFGSPGSVSEPSDRFAKFCLLKMKIIT